MNPMHQVPVVKDDATILYDSRAIVLYLAEKYSRSEDFYPKNAEGRARVNQKIWFDAAQLNPACFDAFVSP